MKEFKMLARILLDQNLGLSMLAYNRHNDTGAFARQLAAIVVIPVALIPAFVVYIVFSSAAYGVLGTLGQVSGYLPLFFAMTSLFIFFFAIAWVMSEFYFSDSVAPLLALPIPPWKIILAKLTVVLVWEYLFALMMMLPPMVVYGAAAGGGVLYVLGCVVVLAVLPILPICLETGLMMLVFGLGRSRGRRDILPIAFAMILLIGIILWQCAAGLNVNQLVAGGDVSVFLDTLAGDPFIILNSLARSYPPVWAVAWALGRDGAMALAGMAVLAGSAALAIVLLAAIGSHFYVRGLLRGDGGGKAARGERKTRRGCWQKPSPGWMAVFTMDFRLMVRTPVFAFNNVASGIIVPLCLALLYPMMVSQDGAELAQDLAVMGGHPEVSLLVLTAFFLFFTGVSSVTATTFSREGRGSWLTRSLPFVPRDQVVGRCLSGLAVELIGIICTCAMVRWLLPVPMPWVLASALLGLLGGTPILLFGLWVDMHRPLIRWDNPQRAVKNNLNVLIVMAAGVVYGAALLGVSGLLYYFAAPALGVAAFFVLSLGPSLWLYRLDGRQLSRCLEKFE